MTATKSITQQDPYWAHIAPFAAFMLIMAVPDLLTSIGVPIGADVDSRASAGESIWASRQLWLYPLQTGVCLGLLAFYRRSYPWKPVRGIGIGLLAGIVGIVLWLLPGFLFQRFQIAFPFCESLGMADRSEGFDAVARLHDHPAAAFWFWSTRLLRLVVVVPIMEEVFWRSFLMRFLADSKKEFYDTEFGKHSVVGLLVVTGLFVAVHQPVDYFGAICFGLLAYWVTIKTKSLPAVFIMHAVANACLAGYAAAFGQWGYL